MGHYGQELNTVTKLRHNSSLIYLFLLFYKRIRKLRTESNFKLFFLTCYGLTSTVNRYTIWFFWWFHGALIFGPSRTSSRAGKLQGNRDTSFSKCSVFLTKRKTGAFKFLRFKKRFPNALFSWRFGVDSRHNRRNKAAFSNLSGVVPTLACVDEVFVHSFQIK